MSEIENAIEELKTTVMRKATMEKCSILLAIKALDQLRWRDAEKELPEELTAVLVYGHCDNKLKRGMDVCWLCDGTWTSWFVNDITYWLPLPQAPEVRK